MERVAFLLEASGERLGCLLNPASLTLQRTAGLQPRRSIGGPFNLAEGADDPLLFTGGGSTELTLDLLFDVQVAGPTLQTDDVRDLTRPLWQLAENSARVDGQLRPPQVRFVWGKAWNIPGVVAAVAERLEHFTTGGAPRRSFLRMRLIRVPDPAPPEAPAPPPPALIQPEEGDEAEAPYLLYQPLGGELPEGSTGDPPPGDRPDQIAWRCTGDPSNWRAFALANGIDDVMRIAAGTVLKIPYSRGEE
jgi:hypothetical protein